MAPSAATGTTGLERLLLIFLMKTQQTNLQRTKPPPTNDRCSNQSVRNSQTPKNFQKRNYNSTPIDSDVETFTKTCNRTTNLRLLQQNSRLTKQKCERTVKLRINRLKTVQTARNFKKSDRKLEQTVETSNYRLKPKRTAENLNSPNQKLERTVENGCTSTQPHRNYRNFKNSRCGWGQALHGPTVGA